MNIRWSFSGRDNKAKDQSEGAGFLEIVIVRLFLPSTLIYAGSEKLQTASLEYPARIRIKTMDPFEVEEHPVSPSDKLVESEPRLLVRGYFALRLIIWAESCLPTAGWQTCMKQIIKANGGLRTIPVTPTAVHPR